MSFGTIASGTLATGAQSAAFTVENNRRSGTIFTVIARGTFSSTVLTVQVSADGTNWVSTSHTLSAAGMVNVTSFAPYYRISAASGSGSGLVWSAH